MARIREARDYPLRGWSDAALRDRLVRVRLLCDLADIFPSLVAEARIENTLQQWRAEYRTILDEVRRRKKLVPYTPL